MEQNYLGGTDGRQQIKLVLPVSRTERKVPAASVPFLLYNGDIQCQLLYSERSLNFSSYLFPACPRRGQQAYRCPSGKLVFNEHV